MKLSSKFTPPTKQSSDAEWIAWYKEIKSEFGKKDANYAFLTRWRLSGSYSANTSSLRDQMKKYGVELSASNIFGTISDQASDFADSIEDTFKVGAYLGIGMGIIVFLMLILIVYRLATPQTVALAARAAV